MTTIKITPPKLTEYQKDLLYCAEKNTICEASTKVGKTFSHMWWIFELAHKNPKVGGHYWWVAPVYKQAKIAFDRMKRAVHGHKAYRINNTELTITTPLGSIIEFKSGENPDNLYGEDVYAAVLDEVSRMREEAWIAVRSTVTATRGAIKMIGNVSGTTNWSYRLARKVESGLLPNWRHFKITCQDAVKEGIISADEVEQARLELPEGMFLELYYGIPFINAANKFAYSFDPAKHAKPCAIDYQLPIYLSFDFNRNPITCTVQQITGENSITVPHLFKLENSNIYNLCNHIKTKLLDPSTKAFEADNIIVNGDATGANSSALVADNINYFRIIKEQLGLSTGQMQQLTVNPKIVKNQLLINAILEHMDVSIDPTNAAGLIFDLQFAEMLPDGTLKKTDRNDPTQQLDALDCFRYFLNRNFARFYKEINNE